MRFSWTKMMASGGVMALVLVLGIVPLAGHAQSVETAPAGGGQSGYRAGLAMPLPAARVPLQRIALAPQSDLKLLSRATKVGPHAPHSKIGLTIGLKLRNVAQLKAFLRDVQNPVSPVFHRFLTPAQFTARYGPSEADVARVLRFLKQHGIEVESVSPNRLLIRTRAETQAYEQAFAIRVNDYRLDGRSFFSTTDRPKLPQALAGIVENVIGLNQGRQVHPRSHFEALPAQAVPHAGASAPRPSLDFLNPLQIAKAYDWPDITEADNGAGVTLAILTYASSGLASLNAPHVFWQGYGLPDHTINVIPVDGDYGLTTGMGETLLDVELSGAMAPGAKLDVYVGATSALVTTLHAMNQMVTDNNAAVVSTSWGLDEAGWGSVAESANNVLMEAAAQGISMFAAAGDYGTTDTGSGNNNADFPSSSPYVTAANGTELTIADVSGTYAGEQAWNKTGGAISQLFAKPDWQTGPGVPAGVDTRMNSDLSLNGGPLHPYIIYGSGGWGAVYGTSAVAPALAGLFAVGVSHQPSRLGQSNTLIYNDVNANDSNYGTDFRDVTSGCNGLLPDGSPSCASVNWDHPTGWGSPRATSLLSHLGVHGPSGMLSGTVTDAASGAPVAGAKIVATTSDGKHYATRSEDDGRYSRVLPVGDFTIGVVSFGYADGTASVSIADGETITQDFSLTAAPTATLSGKVSDGSGHGYGLYADIKVSTDGFGRVADVWTDPATGEYSVALPKGETYTLNVAAAFNGYNTASETLTLADDKSQDFSLTVTDACTAPGYVNPFSEDFNTGWPPSGWSVVGADGSGATWKPSLDWGDDNWTGGTGFAADAHPGNGAYDVSLVTPPIPASAVRSGSVLHYKTDFGLYGGQMLDLDISTDGGGNWTTVQHWADFTCGGQQSLPGCNATFDISSYLPAAGDFQLRWRYYYAQGPSRSNYYVQIDDVRIGACQAVPGGLAFGRVTDANSGEGIALARVADDLGNTVDTTANTADPAFPSGGYLLFLPAGERTLTASDYRYRDADASFTMTNGAIEVRNFALEAGRLSSDPDAFDLHVMVNNHKTRSFSVGNDGSAPAHYRIVSVNAPPPVTAAQGEGAPPIRIEGHYSPLRVTPSLVRRAVQPRGETAPNVAPWRNIADYPVPVLDNGVARDPTTGVVYSVDGVNGGGYLSDVYAYDPVTNAWSAITKTEIAREAPQVAFIGGKLYVVGGWRAGGLTVARLEIYDPAGNEWTLGADIPVAYAGTGYAVVGGKLYIVGGCDSDDTCLSAAVQVYDPATDTWSRAQDYPHPVAREACGGIGGKLYCAGGVSGTATLYKDGYIYDPASDQWSPIRDMPYYRWGSAYAAVNGQLLVSGGVSGLRTLTNANVAYDPVTDRWHDLPNSNRALYKSGGACGFYQVGGAPGGDATYAVPYAEMLPGYAQCGKPVPAPWLTATPASGTLAAGATAQTTLIFDGTGQEEFTTSQAYLKLAGNTPYPGRIVPLTVTWDPQPVNLRLSGEVSPDPIRKGNEFSYAVTVYNRQADNHGAASQVELAYSLPHGVSYRAASGDAACMASAPGSAPAAASGGSASSSVTCDFGRIALGASKTEVLIVKADTAGKLSGTFSVSAREPESDGSDNSLTLESEVIGTADLTLSADQASIPASGRGSLMLTLENAGPDPASGVQIHAKRGSDAISLQSASASQGSCALSGGTLACDLGQVDAGKTVTVTLQLFGAYAGSTTLTAQASTLSDEADTDNNGVTAKVTVKTASQPDNGGDNGGGGALGWLALAALLGLMVPAVAKRRRA